MKDIKKYILLFVVIFLIILVYGIYQLSRNNILIDKSKDIVYTSYVDEDNEKMIPQINIKRISDTINNEIDNFTKDYINIDTNKITYKYQVNGNILSLIVIIEDYSIEGPANSSFLSYIIDLKRLKVLNNKEILDLFNYNEEDIINYMNDFFKDSYQVELDNKVINNITYEDYLKIHEITDFKNEIYYYIENGKLYVYFDYLEWAADKETVDVFVEQGYIFEL